jgi:hypothetical protein
MSCEKRDVQIVRNESDSVCDFFTLEEKRTEEEGESSREETEAVTRKSVNETTTAKVNSSS